MNVNPPSEPTPHPSRRPWLRRLPTLLLSTVLLLGSLVGSLELASVRRMVVAWADGELGRTAGLHLAVDDFSVHLRAGRLEVFGLTLASVGEPPFLSAERIEARWHWNRLRQDGVWKLEEVAVEHPVFDLQAPLPEGQERETTDSGPLPLSIALVRIDDGVVAADELMERGWLAGFRAQEVTLLGALHGNEMEAKDLDARLSLHRRDGAPPIEIELTSHLRGLLTGPWELSGLHVTGEGLDLRAEGRIDRGGQRIPMHFELTAEPTRLLPDLAVGAGVVEAQGDLELRGMEGEVHLRAERFPADLLAPLVGEEILRQLHAQGTHLDLDAQLAAAGWEAGAVVGRAEAFWRRGEEILLKVEAHLPEDGHELRGDFSAELLPALMGTRRVAGTLHWPIAGDLATIDLENTRLTLADENLRSILAQLKRRWPELLSPLSQRVFPAQRFDTKVDLSGPLTNPLAKLQLRLGPPGAATFRLDAKGNPRARAGSARLQLTAFDLAPWALGGLEGVLDGTFEVERKPETWQGAAQLVARQVSTGPDMPVWEQLHLAFGIDGDQFRLLEMVGKAEDLEVTASGSMTLQNPLREARLTLEAQQPSVGLHQLEATAVLAEGVLHLNDGLFQTDAGHGDLEASIPLAALSKMEPLRDLLAGQPLLMADGNIELRLAAQQVEAQALTEMLGMEDLGLRWSADLEAEVSLDPAQPRAASGRLRVGPAVLEVPVSSAAPPLSFALGEAGLHVDLAEGALVFQAENIHSALGELGLDARIPLHALAWLATAEGDEPPSWVYGVDDSISAALSWSGFDSHALAAATGQAATGPRLFGDLALQLQTNPADLPQSSGQVSFEGLQIELDPEQRLVAQDVVTLDLAAGHLTLNPARFQAEVANASLRELVATGTAQITDLPKDFSQLSGLMESRLSNLSGQVDGPLPASFLDPYLGGGRASGLAEIHLDLGGSLDALEADLKISGPGLRILLLKPYSTEVQAPELKISARQGAWQIEQGRARLNGGVVDFSGRFSPTTGFEIKGFLDSLRYRLDHGLNVLMSGNFNLLWPPEKQPRLQANILLERGVLRRDLNLDRSIVDALFGAPQIPGVAAGDSLDMELDLSIATVDGIRVRNNLANLHATWSPITITGSTSQPVVQGGIDIEQGGQIFALGQTVRIDHAGLTFHGIPGAPPEVEIETSNDVEDSSLGNFRSDDAFMATNLRGEAKTNVDLGQALTTGFETYYGERLTDLLGESLGGTRISYRPLLIFGETDTGPRLTLSRDLSPELAFAVAVSLQETETRTYLVDLHELSILPGFAAQAFTNDDNNIGATALKTFDFGGGPNDDDERPRLKEIVFENPDTFSSKGITQKSLRRAIPFFPGDRLPEDVEFEVELDLKDALEKRGFPDAQVEVTTKGVDRRRKEIHLHLEIEPRAQATIVFLGDKPPRGLRRSIASLYHPGFGEEAAVLEMRQRAMEIFRGLGHPEPQVDVSLSPPTPTPEEDRRVLVQIEAGARWKLSEPTFEGVPQEISTHLATSFSTVLERVELALATPAADSRLLAALKRLAYPQARIVSRQLDEGQKHLLVVVEPGPRQFLASIELLGVPETDLQNTSPPLPLQPGDPARIDHIAEAAVLVESDLRRRGFTRARVRPKLISQPDEPTSITLELIAEPGVRRRVGSVETRGQLATRESWIRRMADLEEGELLRTQDLAAARRRLLQSGVFSNVQVETLPQPAGDDVLPSGGAPGGDSLRGDSSTNILFDLEEHPRFSVATGLRWVSSEGLGVVVDVLDRNVLGRGTTVGLRTRYAEDDSSVRLYSVVPRLLASRTNLEIFAQARQRTVQEERIDSLDLAFQLSRPLGRNWRQRIYGRLQNEERRVISLGLTSESTTPLFGFQLIFGEQQVAEIEPRGIFGSIDLSGTHDALGGEQRAWRAFGQINTYHPFKFADSRFTWGQSLRLGWSDAAGEPLRGDLRFRAGGELSVRGYGSGSLGPPPVVEGTEAPGGEALLVLNQELRLRLWDDFHTLLFFDVGNVWDDPKDFGRGLAKSVGLGVRAATPIGLIRLDLAVPLDRRKEDEGLEVYLGFGNIF